ncbi:MAG: carbon-nitrogen hydrolase [Gemmatimonadaceae bacterium]|nr:carbon-nitrogen hydrolase [Gemmatimonadaceae bacterium]
MSPIVKIGIVQDTASDDLEANVTRAVARVRSAASQGAKVICLQELFNAPYFCKTVKPERFDIAQPANGPIVQTFQALAKELDVVIVVPYYEREAPGLYRNSATVIDADGSVLGTYRKMHIPHDPLFEEKYYFAPGDVTGDQRQDRHPGYNGFRVWKTKYATIGVLICWDQWYPEGARITALLGAQILFDPTAIGWHPAEKATFGEAQVDAWRTAQRAHAIANGVFVASPNRVGFEPEPGTDGLEFFGQSFICDPFGRYLAQAGTEPAILTADCDLALIEETRRNWPFLRDRRIDAYGPILNRWLGS